MNGGEVHICAENTTTVKTKLGPSGYDFCDV